LYSSSSQHSSPHLHLLSFPTRRSSDLDIRDMKARSLRSNIGMVLQDNILFSDSIATNIRMGNPEASMEEVVTAAKAANAHDFIRSEEHTSELQSRFDLVCRLLLEKKKK